jgi:hypothetical protein
MDELHVIEGHVTRHLKKGDQLAPVLFLKCFSTAKLEEGPGLLVLFDLSVKELGDHILFHGLNGFLFLHEEVLELEVLTLAESEPFLLTVFVELLLPLFK